MDKLLEESKKLLADLKKWGSFYYSAIEFNNHLKGSIDGEKFEKRIDELLKKIRAEI